MAKEAKVMEFKVTIVRETNGDLAPQFSEPWSDPDTPYEMVKLSLLAAEHREHMKNQCIIVNADYEKRMLLMSEKLVDHEGFYEAQRKRREKEQRVIPDTEKYQLELPWNTKTPVKGEN